MSTLALQEAIKNWADPDNDYDDGSWLTVGYEPNPEADTPLASCNDLWDRIFTSLPPQPGYKPSKKRRVSDRKARYERRDGSPRSKCKRDVDKWSNCNLRRGARRHDKMALVNVGIGGDYVAPMHERVPAGWDTGFRPQSRQA